MDAIIQVIIKLIQSHVSNEVEKNLLIDLIQTITPAMIDNIASKVENDVVGCFSSCRKKNNKLASV